MASRCRGKDSGSAQRVEEGELEQHAVKNGAKTCAQSSSKNRIICELVCCKDSMLSCDAAGGEGLIHCEAVKLLPLFSALLILEYIFWQVSLFSGVKQRMKLISVNDLLGRLSLFWTKVLINVKGQCLEHTSCMINAIIMLEGLDVGIEFCASAKKLRTYQAGFVGPTDRVQRELPDRVG